MATACMSGGSALNRVTVGDSENSAASFAVIRAARRLIGLPSTASSILMVTQTWIRLAFLLRLLFRGVSISRHVLGSIALELGPHPLQCVSEVAIAFDKARLHILPSLAGAMPHSTDPFGSIVTPAA